MCPLFILALILFLCFWARLLLFFIFLKLLCAGFRDIWRCHGTFDQLNTSTKIKHNNKCAPALFKHALIVFIHSFWCNVMCTSLFDLTMLLSKCKAKKKKKRTKKKCSSHACIDSPVFFFLFFWCTQTGVAQEDKYKGYCQACDRKRQ